MGSLDRTKNDDVMLPPWIASIFWVPEKVTPDRWAERNIVLAEGTSSVPGQLSLDWCPYLRKPLQDLVNPEVEHIILCWSTQVGKTLGGICGAQYSAAVLKRPVLHVMPTDPMASGINVERYQPIIQASPELMKLVDPRRKKEFTSDQIRINGIWIDFVGARSPGDLASRAKGMLLLDEVDKFPDWSGDEADPIELATERTRTYWDRKIWKCSTPTTENKYIWPELLRSTNERFNLPCPHCGEYQPLIWGSKEKGRGGLKWPEEVRDGDRIRDERLAWYECRECGGRIDDADKYDMNSRGVWAPKGMQVDKRGRIGGEPLTTARRSGYHLWAAYSPWVTFSEIVEKFLSCFVNGRAIPKKLMNFTNSWRGLPWQETAQELKDAALMSVCLPYHQRQIPDGARYALVTVDVQEEGGHRYMYFVTRGWGDHGRSWLLDQGRKDSWEEIASVLNASFKRAKGADLKPWQAGIDCGFKTDEVYSICLATGAIAIKGSGQLSAQQRLQKVDVGGDEVQRLSINVDYYKDKLHRLIKDQERWWLPSDLPREFFDHMVAEQKVQEISKRTGRPVFVWKCVPPGAPNHLFDCEIYQLALADLLQLETTAGEPPPDGDGFEVKREEVL